MRQNMEETWLGHPRGLFVLFLVEMWERFSYYGMRALLVFYMTKQLLFSQEDASHIYGLYTGLVYMTPLFGGLLADRFLGQRRAVYIGGTLMAIGHFLMAFESLFFPALGFLIAGNGLFKPNISTQVGSLYPAGDKRRDSAFSIFYVGVNLGAFLAPLTCGTLGVVVGWHYGFGLAGVGMLVGLLIYLYGQRYLKPDRLTARKEASAEAEEPLTLREKQKIAALVLLCLLTIPFWAAFEQQGNTLALWFDSDTDRQIGEWEVPQTWFQSLNPMFIFTLTPVITAFWAWQAGRGAQPGAIAKMVRGCLLLGTSFLVLVPAGIWYDVNGTPVSMWWLVTKLAPARAVSMCMGIWYLSQFAGNLLAGYIGGFWEVLSRFHFFLLLASLVFGAACATAVYLYIMKRSRLREDMLNV